MPAVALGGSPEAIPPEAARVAAVGPNVPWHCQSAAQRLIDQIGENDQEISATVKRLVAPIADRLRRKGYHSPARRETLIDLARNWRKLDTPSRLAFTCDFADKGRSLAITDCRLTTTAFTLRNWPQSEEGLAIVLINFRVAPGIGADLTAEVIAVISAHAIGRRMQRGRTDDPAVLADFQRLAAELLTNEAVTQCACPGGTWKGNPVMAHGDHALGVRTFLPNAFAVAWSS